MTRPTLIAGQIWDPALANAAGYPQMTGLDEYGHGPLIRDENLDNDPDQIKARFYDWRDRLKITATTGLTVEWDSTSVITTTGSTVSISAGTLTLPDNTSGFVFVNDSGVITQSVTYPQVGIILAAFTTLSGSIAVLSDLRYQSIGIIAPLAVPTNSTFAIGDLKVSARLTPPEGWLACDGASYSTVAYPQLAVAIGTTYNLPGDAVGTFRVPNLVGRTIVTAGNGVGLSPRTVGQVYGSEQVSLTVNNLPPHNHPVSQAPHTHGVSDPGHNHIISDPGHSHAFSPVPHSHGLNDPGHGHLVASRDSTAGFGVGNVGAEPEFIAPWGYNQIGISQNVWTSPQGTNLSIAAAFATGSIGGSGTGLGIQPRATGVSVQAANANISTGNTGSNIPFDITQPSLVLNTFIRAT